MAKGIFAQGEIARKDIAGGYGGYVPMGYYPGAYRLGDIGYRDLALEAY